MGDRPAVQTGAHCWSYRELNRRANAVAHGLLEACGDGDQRVGLLLGHDAPMLAGLLGTLKAGKTYVPLDPGAPAARLRHWIRGAGLAAVVIDREHRQIAHGILNGDLALVEVDTATPNEWPNPGIAIVPKTLAYILFTSGSTGTPKGVMQTHRNVLHHIRTYTNALHLSSADRLSLLSPYGFDAAVMDIFSALLNGACLVPIGFAHRGTGRRPIGSDWPTKRSRCCMPRRQCIAICCSRKNAGTTCRRCAWWCWAARKPVPQTLSCLKSILTRRPCSSTAWVRQNRRWHCSILQTTRLACRVTWFHWVIRWPTPRSCCWTRPGR